MISLNEQRPRFHGVMQIVRFNWPFYATALIALLVSGIACLLSPAPKQIKAIAIVGESIAVFWLVVSLLVSHVVYDRSGLMKWGWIAAALPAPPRRWVSIHAGLDESSGPLKKLFPKTSGRVFDI